MFIHREKELSALKSLLAKERMTGFIYGKRRVGKSTLIYEALKDFDGTVIDYECLRTGMDGNAAGLEKKAKEVLNNPYLALSSFEDVFAYCATLNKKVLVFIDEYSYLKKQESFAGETDSRFQRIIDHLGPKVSLILSGSYVGMMKESLEAKNPLYGRFDFICQLFDFPYNEVKDFHPQLDYISQINAYLVFGGGPLANSHYAADRTLENNIESLLINNDGVLHNYCDSLVFDELKNKEPAERILQSLGNGKKKYSELEEALKLEHNGSLAKMLAPLLDMGIIEKVAPINKKDNPKLNFYQIKDNLLHFYFTYIFGASNLVTKLGEKTYFMNYISPTLTDYLAHRFESLGQEFLSRLAQCGKLEGVLDVGKYWYDDATTKTNGEYDAAIRFKNGYVVFETKYLKNAVDEQLFNREMHSMTSIKGLDNIKGYGFISLRGYSFAHSDVMLFSGQDFYD